MSDQWFVLIAVFRLFLNQDAFSALYAAFQPVKYDSRGSEMRTYAAKKENPGLSTSYRREQRGTGFIRGKKSDKTGKTFDETVARILEEFSGEVVTGRVMGMHRIENLI